MERTISFIGDAVSTQPQAAYQKMLKSMAEKFDTDDLLQIEEILWEQLDD